MLRLIVLIIISLTILGCTSKKNSSQIYQNRNQILQDIDSNTKARHRAIDYVRYANNFERFLKNEIIEFRAYGDISNLEMIKILINNIQNERLSKTEDFKIKYGNDSSGHLEKKLSDLESSHIDSILNDHKEEIYKIREKNRFRIWASKNTEKTKIKSDFLTYEILDIFVSCKDYSSGCYSSVQSFTKIGFEIENTTNNKIIYPRTSSHNIPFGLLLKDSFLNIYRTTRINPALSGYQNKGIRPGEKLFIEATFGDIPLKNNDHILFYINIDKDDPLLNKSTVIFKLPIDAFYD